MAVKSRRSYQGKPVSNTLGSQLLVGGTSISLAATMSGWPTSAEPFFCVIDPGTAKEEKVCVVYATTTTLTVVDPADYTSPWGASADGRGVDNTTAYQHEAGAVIYPCITAREMDEANELVSKYASQGAVVYQGSSTFTELAIGTAGQVLKVNSGATAPEWGQVPTAGIADDAVTLPKLAFDLTGVITAFGGSSAPTGWLLCDGSAVSRSTYADLFAIVSTTYGNGDGSTTFNVPNLKGKVPVGKDAAQTEFDTLGETGGAKTVTLSSSEMPSHVHNVSAYTHTSSSGSTDIGHTHTYSGNVAAAGDHSHSITISDPGHSHTIDLLNRERTSGSAFNTNVVSFTANETQSTRAATTGITASSNTTGSHQHTFSGTTAAASISMNHSHTVTVNQHDAKNTDATGGGAAHNNLQPYIVVNYIIKH